MEDEDPASGGSPAASPPGTPEGTWERGGRSLNSAALAGLLGVGVIYFYGQSFVVTIAVLATTGREAFAGQTEGLFKHLITIAELTKTPIRVCLIVTQFAFMLLPTLWLIRRWHTADVRSYIRLRRCSPSQLALAVCAIAFLFPVNIVVSEFFESRLNIPEKLLRINETLFTASGAGELAFVILAIAVTPAICEEILFRGYVQRTLERTIGWKSVVVVGILFGLYHMQPLGLLTLSGLGLVFGYFYYASNSLFPGMAAHFTNNLLVVVWLYIVKTDALGSFHLTTGAFTLLASIALPSAALSLYLFHRVSTKPQTPAG
jgi:membrane protease YdiL (CAAX protease family)